MRSAARKRIPCAPDMQAMAKPACCPIFLSLWGTTWAGHLSYSASLLMSDPRKQSSSAALLMPLARPQDIRSGKVVPIRNMPMASPPGSTARRSGRAHRMRPPPSATKTKRGGGAGWFYPSQHPPPRLPGHHARRMASRHPPQRVSPYFSEYVRSTRSSGTPSICENRPSMTMSASLLHALK